MPVGRALLLSVTNHSSCHVHGTHSVACPFEKLEESARYPLFVHALKVTMNKCARAVQSISRSCAPATINL